MPNEDRETASPLLGHSDAAKYLKVSEGTLRNIVRRGLIDAVRLSPRRVAYLRKDLDAYIERVREGRSESGHA